MKIRLCPVCDDYMSEDEDIRFGMCTQCFTDSILDEERCEVIRDFLMEYRREFGEYVYDNCE